ncbi:class I SAM-dependent methyltransferase [Plantactinospora siamensis]|uniref:Class I SAM-dependent methyltransferase n=1 Tax=Plantactinospora siamensis TaxID=555372 RepID=A0ABV6P4Z0_9ACTN
MGSPDAARSGLAGTFRHRGVAEAYRHRPPYPAEVFGILDRLVVDEPRVVLDLGAGEGALARPLAARMSRVDAVEVSVAMVEAGRNRPGGARDNLRWIVGGVESVPLHGPYGLVTAGASLHWMRWRPLMRRLSAAMTERAVLAIVDHGARDLPWAREVTGVIRRHSRSARYDPGYSLVNALRTDGCFRLVGRVETAPVPFRQPVEAYVEQFHSTASLARELMPEREAADFDAAIEAAVRPWARDGMLELPIVATLSWGRPA